MYQILVILVTQLISVMLVIVEVVTSFSVDTQIKQVTEQKFQRTLPIALLLE